MPLDATVGVNHIIVTALHLKWLVIVLDVIWEVSQKSATKGQHNPAVLLQKASPYLRMGTLVVNTGIAIMDSKQIV